MIQGRPESTEIALAIITTILRPLRQRWRDNGEGVPLNPLGTRSVDALADTWVYADNLFMVDQSEEAARTRAQQVIELFRTYTLEIGTAEVWSTPTELPVKVPELAGVRVQEVRTLPCLGTSLPTTCEWDATGWTLIAWRKRWAAVHLLACAKTPTEAFDGWKQCWDNWSWNQLAVMDGLVAELRGLDNKLWRLHVIIVSLKVPATQNTGEDNWYRTLARAVRQARDGSGWEDALGNWARRWRNWRSAQLDWP